VSVDWFTRAERYIADGELWYGLWALSAALRRSSDTEDLDGATRVLEMAEELRPSLLDRRSEQHCDILTSSARAQIRFLTHRVAVKRLVELRDTGAISLDEYDKRIDEIPDWRMAHEQRPRSGDELGGGQRNR
jgi:hypothetical protein